MMLASELVEFEEVSTVGMQPPPQPVTLPLSHATVSAGEVAVDPATVAAVWVPCPEFAMRTVGLEGFTCEVEHHVGSYTLACLAAIAGTRRAGG